MPREAAVKNVLDLAAGTVERAVVTTARAEHLCARYRERWRAFLCGLASESLSVDELDALTVRLYALAPGLYGRRSLEAWEAAMFDRALPPAPARVLVTAAGSGREARALIAEGYLVDCLEPVPAMAEACAAVEGIGDVWTASHSDLVTAVEQGGGPAAALADRRFDAIVVGWGSFTHVLSRDRQHRLLAACDRLAPSGPIFVSFFARAQGTSRQTRSLELGSRLGRRLAAGRGLERGDLQIGLAWHLGFTHALTTEEIEALAVALGRTAEIDMSPYGHAVLRPARPV